ncbi:hypothetical protein CEY12_15045 [Chryseobacterium sp. T16E-39]|uniref:hypothetical protein n=1 Tax=Chryseobacterium sp. T16E-39 TaxID=2015076 RepID=UPI000B5B48CD|nr:hypothetical protein [Chryseobacterium sp. T16E-39]ASK31340.1 hypothetical protein CEY12_15045 [Chryseobacterium sp. T16E-39]
MNLKLILSGVILIALLVACEDRSNEETSTTLQSKNTKIDMTSSKTAMPVSDSVKIPAIQNDSNSANGGKNETIDPTKPDRPR